MQSWLPIPATWDGLHPIITHFPIVLLLIAPLFVILGMVKLDRWKMFSVSALILMALGSAAAFIAVSTGEAAAEMAEKTPQVVAALERHEDLAEDTRLAFSILTAVFAVIVIGPALIKRTLPRRLRLGLHALFLVAYLGACLVLARTGHEGGMLVHQLGVRAMMIDAPGEPHTVPVDETSAELK
jgi:uncharacterized membrane protein